MTEFSSTINIGIVCKASFACYLLNKQVNDFFKLDSNWANINDVKLRNPSSMISINVDNQNIKEIFISSTIGIFKLDEEMNIISSFLDYIGAYILDYILIVPVFTYSLAQSSIQESIFFLEIN